MNGDCRRFAPTRVEKRAFQQSHVKASLRRALRHQGAPWPAIPPTAPYAPVQDDAEATRPKAGA